MAFPIRTPDAGARPVDSSQELERLRAEITQLKEDNAQLRAQREDLLEENRQLRQEATVVRLYKNLSRTYEPVDGAAHPLTPQAEQEKLYQTLPDTVTVREFFQHADTQGVDTQRARECLLHFLKHNLLAQAGSRLDKPPSDDSPPATDD